MNNKSILPTIPIALSTHAYAVEEYARQRVLQIVEPLVLRLAPTADVSQAEKVARDLLEAYPTQTESAGRHLYLSFQHDCGATGCIDASCAQCANNQWRQCACNFGPRFVERAVLGPKCEKDVRVVVMEVDPATGRERQATDLPELTLVASLVAGPHNEERLTSGGTGSNGGNNALLLAMNGGTTTAEKRIEFVMPAGRGEATLPRMLLTCSSEAQLRPAVGTGNGGNSSTTGRGRGGRSGNGGGQRSKEDRAQAKAKAGEMSYRLWVRVADPEGETATSSLAHSGGGGQHRQLGCPSSSASLAAATALQVQGAYSEQFQVTTGRAKKRIDRPPTSMPVDVLDRVGKETARKLGRLTRDEVTRLAATAGAAPLMPALLPPSMDQNGIATVGDFRLLARAARDSEKLTAALRDAAGMPAGHWLEAVEHAERAVLPDMRMRVFFPPSCSPCSSLSASTSSEMSMSNVGALFKCFAGVVDMEAPAGLAHRQPLPPQQAVGGAIHAVSATHTDRLTSEQRQLLLHLRDLAVQFWSQPAHPGWDIIPADSAHYLSTGELRAVGPNLEQQLNQQQQQQASPSVSIGGTVMTSHQQQMNQQQQQASPSVSIGGTVMTRHQQQLNQQQQQASPSVSIGGTVMTSHQQQLNQQQQQASPSVSIGGTVMTRHQQQLNQQQQQQQTSPSVSIGGTVMTRHQQQMNQQQQLSGNVGVSAGPSVEESSISQQQTASCFATQHQLAETHAAPGGAPASPNTAAAAAAALAQLPMPISAATGGATLGPAPGLALPMPGAGAAASGAEAKAVGDVGAGASGAVDEEGGPITGAHPMLSDSGLLLLSSDSSLLNPFNPMLFPAPSLNFGMLGSLGLLPSMSMPPPASMGGDDIGGCADGKGSGGGGGMEVLPSLPLLPSFGPFHLPPQPLQQPQPPITPVIEGAVAATAGAGNNGDGVSAMGVAQAAEAALMMSRAPKRQRI